MQIFASDFPDNTTSSMSETDISSLVSAYHELFVHRSDAYALQTRSGSYFAKKAPVTHEVILRHLKGELTAGFYAMDSDSTVRWLALDGDQTDSLEHLQEAWKRLDQLQIPSYLEGSRRGAHLWLFFEPLPASAARRFVLSLLPELQGVEVYPKRDELDGTVRLGSLVRGPLGIHRRSGQRYPFLDPVSLKPVSSSLFGMLGYLLQAERVRHEQLAELPTSPQLPAPLPAHQEPTRGRRRALSPLDRLKTQIGDPYAFIGQFVALDSAGRGHCPFHPPDRNPSFAVNRQAGYWVDFHEVNPRTGRYAGGDAIEFYRRLRGLSYKEVISELSSKFGSDKA